MDKTIAIADKPQVASETASLKQRRKPILRKTTFLGWLFLLPTLVLMTYTSFIPAIWNLILSFQNSSLFTSEFVGLANYLDALQDPVFLISLCDGSRQPVPVRGLPALGPLPYARTMEEVQCRIKENSRV